MKKYIVKYKGSDKVFGEYTSKEEASDKVMEYIHDHYISPFDFILEEVECKEVNEEITDFESAKKYLVGNRLSKSIDPIQDAEILIKELNPKHIEALVALNRLFTIAEAWNNADGFVPDFSDMEQEKWFPTFLKDENARLVFNRTISKNIGTKLCFKDPYRARKFGEQFTDLYNKLIL